MRTHSIKTNLCYTPGGFGVEGVRCEGVGGKVLKCQSSTLVEGDYVLTQANS